VEKGGFSRTGGGNLGKVDAAKSLRWWKVHAEESARPGDGRHREKRWKLSGKEGKAKATRFLEGMYGRDRLLGRRRTQKSRGLTGDLKGGEAFSTKGKFRFLIMGGGRWCLRWEERGC